MCDVIHDVLSFSRVPKIICRCNNYVGPNKYAFRAFRRRDLLQQYANGKSLQKFLQTFANFWSIYFILFYFTCESGITAMSYRDIRPFELIA